MLDRLRLWLLPLLLYLLLSQLLISFAFVLSRWRRPSRWSIWRMKLYWVSPFEVFVYIWGFTRWYEQLREGTRIIYIGHPFVETTQARRLFTSILISSTHTHVHPSIRIRWKYVVIPWVSPSKYSSSSSNVRWRESGCYPLRSFDFRWNSSPLSLLVGRRVWWPRTRCRLVAQWKRLRRGCIHCSVPLSCRIGKMERNRLKVRRFSLSSL